MNREDIEVKVKQIVSDLLARPVEEFQNVHSFDSDLQADSLDAVEIIMHIEDEFNLNIPDEEADKFVTVESVINYINGRIN